ncbi:MAG: SPOR domain-containing protein [Burkholderiales bacterium]|nr:SPOR domain-containing protein [Burkholderiales bacterium]
MAKAPTEEQAQLRRRARRRLIGAMALVTLIAVVLPWVLESEPRQGDQEVSIQIPAPESAGPFNPNVAPGKAPSASADAGPAGSAETKPGAPAATDNTKDEPDKAPPAAKSALPKPPVKERAPAEAKKKTPDKAEAGDSKPYVVQITALADADKAAELQQELTAKGLRAYTEKVKTAAGEVTRVRIGPFPNRDAADKERARIKSLGVDGNVVPR